MGVIDQNWFWFGNQGLSYIQLGRFWQIGFFIGLVLRERKRRAVALAGCWLSGGRRPASSGPGASAWNT